MPTSSPTNPYEPPREARPQAPDFSDPAAVELADLRRRVDELERRVGSSWVVHPNFLLRVFAVFGYWVVGYAILAALAGGVMLLVRLLNPRF